MGLVEQAIEAMEAASEGSTRSLKAPHGWSDSSLTMRHSFNFDAHVEYSIEEALSCIGVHRTVNGTLEAYSMYHEPILAWIDVRN